MNLEGGGGRERGEAGRRQRPQIHRRGAVGHRRSRRQYHQAGTPGGVMGEEGCFRNPPQETQCASWQGPRHDSRGGPPHGHHPSHLGADLPPSLPLSSLSTAASLEPSAHFSPVQPRPAQPTPHHPNRAAVSYPPLVQPPPLRVAATPIKVADAATWLAASSVFFASQAASRPPSLPTRWGSYTGRSPSPRMPDMG